MGGAVAARFTGLHPHRVEHLVLLDASHFDMVLSPEWPDFVARIAQLNNVNGYESQEGFVTTMMALFPRAERPLVEKRAALLICK